MDGADIQVGKTNYIAQLLLAPLMNPILQFRGSFLRECERDNVVGRASGTTISDGSQQLYNSLRHHFGLARARACNKLQIASNVAYRVLLAWREAGLDRISLASHGRMINVYAAISRELSL